MKDTETTRLKIEETKAMIRDAKRKVEAGKMFLAHSREYLEEARKFLKSIKDSSALKAHHQHKTAGSLGVSWDRLERSWLLLRAPKSVTEKGAKRLAECERGN